MLLKGKGGGVELLRNDFGFFSGSLMSDGLLAGTSGRVKENIRPTHLIDCLVSELRKLDI